jgi:hypothetical protein
MSKIGVSLKIDVTKIDKSKLFKGAKGTYCDLTAWIDIDTKDKYDNNGMIVQSVSEEEKKQGIKGAILGNSKVFYVEGAQTKAPEEPKADHPFADMDDDEVDSIPF